MLALVVAGASISILAVAVLTIPVYLPEMGRRESAVQSFFRTLASEYKVRGRLRFSFRSEWPPDLSDPEEYRPPVCEFIPTPDDELDLIRWYRAYRDLRARVGRFEVQAAKCASSIFWTDHRIVLVGLTLAAIGALVSITGAVI
jgi:hypothetical protein